MTEIAVYVQPQGEQLWIPCRGYPADDGAFWVCPCRTTVIRVSFGIMNGLYRCKCGAEVSLIVNGEEVDIREITQEALKQPYCDGQPEAAPVNDSEFLRECGIAIKEENNNA